MKKLSVCLSLLVAAVLIAFALRKMSGSPSKRPGVKRTHTMESLLNVHGSKRETFTICGRSFPSPKGAPPYYLTLPDRPGIIFSYEQRADESWIVYCNTNTC